MSSDGLFIHPWRAPGMHHSKRKDVFLFAFKNNASAWLRISLKAFGVVIIAALTGLCCSRGIDMVNAWNGWAPPSYVWAWNDEQTFLKLDFLQEHNLHVGNSLAMRIYPLAYGLLGIEPELTQYIFIFLTALLYAASLWLLTSTLFPRVSSVGLWLVIGVALLTEAANGNLAGFGQANLSLGQAYSVAIPLQVTALALVMRGRLLSVGVVLGLLTCVHLTLGVMTVAIVAIMLCWKLIIWRDWRFWTAGSIVSVCTLAWAFGVVNVGGGSYVRMENTAWVLWMRFSNFHWFPFDLGVFTAQHYFRITPLLALAILAGCCSAIEMTSIAVRRSWIIGLVASTIITIIGLINSLYPVSQSLVMVALHRASGITLLLLLPVAVLCLARFLERGNATTGSIAAMAIASPFFGSYGVPLLPAVALAGFVLYGRQDHGLSLKQRWVVIFLAMAAIGYVLFLVIAGHAHIFDIAFVGRREAWLTACAFFTIKIIPAIIRRRKSYSEGFPQAVIMMLIVGLLWMGVYRNWNSHPQVPQSEAQAYLDAQKWARDNTPQNAVFMPDPAQTYGWKDYSRRASYGNIRDWTHSVIVYRSDALKFAEGIRRARRMGVDPELYLARAVATAKLSPVSPEYQKMYRDIRSAYYKMSGTDLLNLAHDEGINYFVFQLKYANLLQLKSVYQNAHFAICEPILQEYRVIAEETFPISLPSTPVHCDELLKPHYYDWVNRGSRGTIWLNMTEDKIATLRLDAGTYNQKGEHALLLSPKAESEMGFQVVSGAQVVTFECNMRYIGQKKSGRDILLRFDVFSSQDGWSYHTREIDVGEEWSHIEKIALLASNAVNIYPTLVWTPESEEDALELNSPRMRWLTIADKATR
jgi:hypothetical protein